jgi:uncharacterized paraquat-inducible protein A
MRCMQSEHAAHAHTYAAHAHTYAPHAQRACAACTASMRRMHSAHAPHAQRACAACTARMRRMHHKTLMIFWVPAAPCVMKAIEH